MILPFVLVVCANGGYSAHILALVPMNMKSHFIVMEPLFHELVARGHQVTVYSSFPQKTPLANYTDFDLSYLFQPFVSYFSLDLIKRELSNPLVATSFIHSMHHNTCMALDEPIFKDVFHAKGKYDLLITEIFGTDCFAYFSYKLNIPMIYFTTSMSLPWASERMGLPDNPSYIANYFVNLPEKMSFWQRTYNTVINLYAKFMHLWIYSKEIHSFSEIRFGESLPPLNELAKNASLLFVNSYHAVSQSRPFPPNVIEVGGIHIRKRQPLPRDLEKILNEAKHGVVLVSFGSVVRTAMLPKSIIIELMKAFAKIPQTVLFKYEEELIEKPPNVITRQWLPQRDIAEHENVVAVVAHGGLSSTIETVQFGKPFVGIPFFADQSGNVGAIARRGAGVQLDPGGLTEEKISWALDQVLHNPKIKESMNELSRQFRDRPLSALDTAVFWTEYVLRHRGAPHLRPASVQLAWYQYLLLDVVALFALAIATILSAVYFCLKMALSRTRGSKLSVGKDKVN